MNNNTNNVHIASKAVDFSGATSLLNRYIPVKFYTHPSQFNIHEITHQSMRWCIE